MSSISESVSHDAKTSSSTTTVPDISSMTDSSSNRSLVRDLKQRIELLKTQLSQRERELSKEKWKKEGETVSQSLMKTELRQLQQKSSSLTGMCNDLLLFIQQNEEEETVRLKEFEAFYKENIRTLTNSANCLRTENGQLKQKLSACEGKVTAVIHENNFLRWDVDARVKELQELKREYEESSRELSSVKSQNSSLENELRQLKRFQSEKVDNEIENAARATASKIEKVKRVHDDREKEYGLTLSRMQNEIDFLRSEIARKTEQAERLTQMMDQLTLDNKKLYEFHGEASKETEDEREAWKDIVRKLEGEVETLTGQRDSLRASLEAWREGAKENALHIDDTENQLAEKEALLETARTNTVILRKQLAEVTAVQGKSLPEVRHELKIKTVRLIELENKLEQTRREYLEERAQRIDSSVVILEMSKDMKKMIATLRNGQ